MLTCQEECLQAIRPYLNFEIIYSQTERSQEAEGAPSRCLKRMGMKNRAKQLWLSDCGHMMLKLNFSTFLPVCRFCVLEKLKLLDFGYGDN